MRGCGWRGNASAAASTWAVDDEDGGWLDDVQVCVRLWVLGCVIVEVGGWVIARMQIRACAYVHWHILTNIGTRSSSSSSSSSSSTYSHFPPHSHARTATSPHRTPQAGWLPKGISARHCWIQCCCKARLLKRSQQWWWSAAGKAGRGQRRCQQWVDEYGQVRVLICFGCFGC